MSGSINETGQFIPPSLAKEITVSLYDERSLEMSGLPCPEEKQDCASHALSGKTDEQQEVSEAFTPWELPASLRESVRGSRRHHSFLRQSLEADRLKFVAGRYKKSSCGNSDNQPRARKGPDNDCWRKGHHSAPKDIRPLTKTQAIETLQRKAAVYRDRAACQKAQDEAPTVGGPSTWSDATKIDGTNESRLRSFLGQWCIEILERVKGAEPAAKGEAIRQLTTFRAQGSGGIASRERRLKPAIPGGSGFVGEFYKSSIEHWQDMAAHCEWSAELIASLPSTNGHAVASKHHEQLQS